MAMSGSGGFSPSPGCVSVEERPQLGSILKAKQGSDMQTRGNHSSFYSSAQHLLLYVRNNS
jgi:hypothetical protein